MQTVTAKQMSKDTTEELQLGRQVDSVQLDINYGIIEHFSQHLYSSPNKAIEELVVNGFDAFASWVHVYLPGQYALESVIVWDNGTSMDVDGLKGLWQIAESPKRVGKERIAEHKGKKRKVIGKFGIGKLASYTVGKQIAHLCKIDRTFYLIRVDYEDVLNSTEERESDNSSESNGQHEATLSTTKPAEEPEREFSLDSDYVDKGIAYSSPILELNSNEARSFIVQWLNEVPKDFDNLFSEESWTFAVISELKQAKLSQKRLSWILGNGMPLRPDFSVFVDASPVSSALESKSANVEWEIDAKELREAIVSEFVSGGFDKKLVKFGHEKGLDPSNPKELIPFVELPMLGKVWGSLRLFEKSLVRNRSTDVGRSHGFFVFVRQRLINQTDDKLFLDEPSYGAFYRLQIVLNVDSLDEDLLADRERFAQDAASIEAFKLLQKALYKALRNKHEEQMQMLANDETIVHRLPTFSREYYVEPLTSLWMKSDLHDDDLSFEVNQPEINRRVLPNEEKLAVLEASGFAVNSNHPYFKALENITGNTKQGKEFIREIEILAVAERLFEGFLYDIGIPDDKVSAIMDWRDNLFRTLSQVSRTSIQQLGEELKASSYRGKAEFELKLAEVLCAMGFRATRHGESGEKDIFLLAPAGDDSYTLIFEAKGKNKGTLANDNAEISSAAAHRDSAEADWAVVVTREFAGFKRKEKPQVLEECKSVEGVSIMEVDAVVRLLHVMNDYLYPLDQVKHIFTTIESPAEKMAQIEKLDKPLEFFNYRELLERAWALQGGDAQGEPIAYRPIYQAHYRKEMNLKELGTKWSALQQLAYPLIQFDPNKEIVALRQAPEKIVQRIEIKIASRSDD